MSRVRLFHRIDVWRPRHPTRLGTQANEDYRLWSLRWLMVRVWRERVPFVRVRAEEGE